MRNKPDISIIIPHFNASDTLKKCVFSINKSDFKNKEIIIVDDASEDMIKVDNCKVVKLNKRRGPAYARNLGAKKAKSDKLVFLDSDVEVQRNTLKRIYSKLRNNKIIQGVYTKHLKTDNLISIYKNQYSNYKFSLVNNYLNSISSFCFAIKKKDFWSIGGFDLNYTCKQGSEDVDFGYRAHKKGFKIILDRKVKVLHLKKYNLKNFILSEHIKAKSNLKILLRNKFSKNKSFNLLDYPISKSKLKKMLHLVMSIILAPLIILSLIMSLINGSFLIICAVLCALFILLNLKFIRLSHGVIKSTIVIFIHLLQLLNVFISLNIGIVEYIQGKRY